MIPNKEDLEKAKPWENSDGSTNVDGFLKAFAEDDNTFWRMESGHALNVIEELIDRLVPLTPKPTKEDGEVVRDILPKYSTHWPIQQITYADGSKHTLKGFVVDELEKLIAQAISEKEAKIRSELAPKPTKEDGEVAREILSRNTWSILSKRLVVWLEKEIAQALASTRKDAYEKAIKSIEAKIPQPDSYHYLCHGGSTIRIVDTWGKEPIFHCGRKGKHDWMCKTCENCDGELQGTFELNEYCRRKKYGLDTAIEAIRSLIEMEGGR